MSFNFYIFAVAALGKGLSGSDRIFIEFAKRLSQKNKVTVFVWQEGYEICKREGLSDPVSFKIINVDFWCKFGFVICYFARIIKSVNLALFITIDKPEETIIYSASEFWMDSLPAFVLKLRYPKTRWMAAWFQTAPNPLVGFSQGVRQRTYKLSAFFYWFMQIPIKPLISRVADFVLVNNETEKKHFLALNRKNRVIVVFGAVNVLEIEKWKFKNRNVPKIYDGVFQGRFHPQKGVVELVKIWNMVVKKLPQAKLAMIGDGPLMSDVKDEIKKLNLENNIKVFGYLFDGDEKYKIFSQSKLVVHPAFYDSGGMAAAEAMVFGIPAVGFDLESYKSYYPQGMSKVKIGNLKLFAETILRLIKNEKERESQGEKARRMVRDSWSWDQRVALILNALKS